MTSEDCPRVACMKVMVRAVWNGMWGCWPVAEKLEGGHIELCLPATVA